MSNPLDEATARILADVAARRAREEAGRAAAPPSDARTVREIVDDAAMILAALYTGGERLRPLDPQSPLTAREVGAWVAWCFAQGKNFTHTDLFRWVQAEIAADLHERGWALTTDGWLPLTTLVPDDRNHTVVTDVRPLIDGEPLYVLAHKALTGGDGRAASLVPWHPDHPANQAQEARTLREALGLPPR